MKSTTTPWQTSPNTSKWDKQKERTGLQENQFALILCINMICCQSVAIRALSKRKVTQIRNYSALSDHSHSTLKLITIPMQVMLRVQSLTEWVCYSRKICLSDFSLPKCCHNQKAVCAWCFNCFYYIIVSEKYQVPNMKLLQHLDDQIAKQKKDHKTKTLLWSYLYFIGSINQSD